MYDFRNLDRVYNGVDQINQIKQSIVYVEGGDSVNG